MRAEKALLTARQFSKRKGSLQCKGDGNRVFISDPTAEYLEGTIMIG